MNAEDFAHQEAAEYWTQQNPTVKGQVMSKNEEYFAAVRLLMETTPNLTAKTAIKMVAKRKRVNFEAVNSGYYRQQRTMMQTGVTPQRPTQAEILAKLEPIKSKQPGPMTTFGKANVTTRQAAKLAPANGNVRYAALSALREYEAHLEVREAAIEKREQQMDELRAKIATLV